MHRGKILLREFYAKTPLQMGDKINGEGMEIIEGAEGLSARK
jgi:hypothetical protein